jgi:hypothetical protein
MTSLLILHFAQMQYDLFAIKNILTKQLNILTGKDAA